MSDKYRVAFHTEVMIQEQLYRPPAERWQAQFLIYPHGYYRGQGRTPAAALSLAWRRFERELSPGRRWWLVAGLPLG